MVIATASLVGSESAMRIFTMFVVLASGGLWWVSCQENPDFIGGTGDGETNDNDWVSPVGGGGGGAGDADADADGDADPGGDGDAGTPDACVLTGEVGLNVGDLAPDVTLYRCDGEAVQAHRLFCDSPYTFLYRYAEW